MNLLLDTHVFLWWDAGSEKLGTRAKSLIETSGNTVFVSAASVLEIAIKRRLGKLAFAGSASAAIDLNGFAELPISAAVCEAAGRLDWAHGDPFDRLLLAQAQRHELSLVTADAVLLEYGGVAIVPAR